MRVSFHYNTRRKSLQHPSLPSIQAHIPSELERYPLINDGTGAIDESDFVYKTDTGNADLPLLQEFALELVQHSTATRATIVVVAQSDLLVLLLKEVAIGHTEVHLHIDDKQKGEQDEGGTQTDDQSLL